MAPTAEEWDMIIDTFSGGFKRSTTTSTVSSLPLPSQDTPTERSARRPATMPKQAQTMDLPSFSPAPHVPNHTKSMDLPAIWHDTPTERSARKPATMPKQAQTMDLPSSSPTSQVLNHAKSLESVNKGLHFEAKYSVLPQVLGKGMTGVVRKAERNDTGEQFAVKISKNYIVQGKAWKLMLDGVKIHKELEHPNIVRLEDVYVDDRSVHVVMEHCTGGDLASALADCGKYSEEDAKIIIQQILKAVDYLHDECIVHRDIKTENILLDRIGSLDVKLIDFGLATRWDGLTRMDLVCGTSDYSAPELLRGSYTDKADLWSIGVVAHALLTGKLLWQGSEWAIRKQAQEGYVDLSSMMSNCSAQAQDFVACLLTSTPNDRLNADEALSHPWLLS